MNLITRKIVFVFIFSVSAFAHAEQPNITGMFSTFLHSEKSGDISGAEIHIVPNPIGFSAVVQASEGYTGFPEVVSLTVKASTVEFTIPEQSASGFAPGKYTGTISNKGILLHGPTGLYQEYFLPRAKSLWQ